jgi:hypothetical protein
MWRGWDLLVPFAQPVLDAPAHAIDQAAVLETLRQQEQQQVSEPAATSDQPHGPAQPATLACTAAPQDGGGEAGTLRLQQRCQRRRRET